MTKARVLGLGFGILLILAAFGVVLWQAANTPVTNTASAQGAATATPSAAATPAPPQNQSTTQSQIGDTFWGILAGKLGVSVDDLKSKAVQARQEMLDQAVKDGRVTQAQADELKQRITSNNLIQPIQLPRTANQAPNNNLPRRGPFGFGNRGPMMGPGFGGFGLGLFGFGLEGLNAVASALKMEPKALVEQLSQGKSLADIAKAQGVDEATVKQAIISFATAQIDQRLALGLLSEAQANALKARLTPDNIDLSRGLHFQFKTAPGQSKSSELLPDFEMGQMFGILSDEGMMGNKFMVPFDVQTQ